MKKLIYLSAIIILAACNKPKDKATELADMIKERSALDAKIDSLQKKLGKKDSVKSIDVSTVTAEPGNFTNYVDLQGHIDAKDNVIAYPQAAAVITAIYVKAGEHVKKGQILVQLNNSVLTEQIAQAQTQVSLNQTVFQRQKNLWDQKIGTEVQYLQAKSNYEASQKQVDGLKQQSDMYRIISPISGTVDQMDLKLGQAASPGATGIRIVNTDNLKVKADVPESYATDINQGDNVKVVIPDANDSLMLKVTFAAKVIDPGSRSFGIEIQLPPNKALRPNMTATIRVADYSKKNSLTVPLKAIQHSDTSTFVFINQNGIAKRQPVKIGNTYGGKSEILTGIVAGEQVVTEGASDIEDGDKLRVLNSAN
ncbi:MAG TPA: efflux RND transporter periplasmic adaptor subunit [Mucilaginibacter sp.]|jgi:RND family efflux transporter MFP subunit|nr:efflux RND transporter periplasmic adaptor subunit [Mucilaginibacter sp.]